VDECFFWYRPTLDSPESLQGDCISAVLSALEVFLNDMRYINPRFTYLLTLVMYVIFQYIVMHMTRGSFHTFTALTLLVGLQEEHPACKH